MRIFSILTAILVTTCLYLLIFERDSVLSFAFRGEPAEAQESEEPAVAEAESAESEDSDERVVSVVALRSKAQQIDSAVLVRGRTEAARQVDVRSETSGTIETAPLRKGAKIEAGQLLCRIDPGTRQTLLAEAEARLPEAQSRLPEAEARIPEAQGRLAEAEARLAEAKINDNAARSLSADGFASETRVAATTAAVQAALAGVESAKAGVETARAGLEAARAGVRSAEAAVASAQKEIERLSLHAPFAGLLETDTAELGALLQPGGLCATIIQLDPMKLVGFVPEVEINRVIMGAEAGARMTSGQIAQGEVTFISRSSDPETRTFRVEISVPNPDLSLRDGQTAEIVIRADGESAHLLPSSSLTLDDDGALGVRTVNDDMAGFSPVTIIRDTVEGVWVTGLPEEVDVITVGQEYVIDGVKVAPTFDEGKS